MFSRQWQMGEYARDDLPLCRDLRHRRGSADRFHVSLDFHICNYLLCNTMKNHLVGHNVQSFVHLLRKVLDE